MKFGKGLEPPVEALPVLSTLVTHYYTISSPTPPPSSLTSSICIVCGILVYYIINTLIPLFTVLLYWCLALTSSVCTVCDILVCYIINSLIPFLTMLLHYQWFLMYSVWHSVLLTNKT